jgi:hypothetical protein
MNRGDHEIASGQISGQAIQRPACQRHPLALGAGTGHRHHTLALRGGDPTGSPTPVPVTPGAGAVGHTRSPRQAPLRCPRDHEPGSPSARRDATCSSPNSGPPPLPYLGNSRFLHTVASALRSASSAPTCPCPANDARRPRWRRPNDRLATRTSAAVAFVGERAEQADRPARRAAPPGGRGDGEQHE